MRIKCLHGYFIFKESSPGEASRFMSLYPGVSLVPVEDYYTFEALAEAPTHVIAGNTYLGVVSTVTLEGKPFEIMRANDLVYDILSATVVNIESVVQKLELAESSHYFVSPGLIQPGSVRDDGERVKDYAAFFHFDSQRFRYTDVSYE